ncbi:ATP-binding protein [Mycobacterium sp. 236(2023)]|uniref:sensor histidine kinase n=1 Tax=Mycobacterium sp. 236(2023) TaxID=3038163 RepID=UPI002414F64D|nr:ATP-binding protein [Mycobacterium sp. 236(2023)]MDG4664081.1 ATP-binding protein [Mycobacterium sp. 236(2023)]
MATIEGPAARYQLMSRAAMVGLLMRGSINLGVALIALADPGSLAVPAGKWLLVALAAWSGYRLLTRSQNAIPLAADYALTLAVCLAIPLLAPATDFFMSNTAPQAIAGTAVISICVSVSVSVSIPMTLGIAAAYATGAAQVIGWESLSSVTALYYFAVQCATASIIRFMLLRVAGAIDTARRDRAEAEVARQVSVAVRDYEHEQLALLHDTAASTLLMVGQGLPLPSGRLAAQARRDLDLLNEGAWVAPPPRVELVAALRECASHLMTPVRFTGCELLWLPGEQAHPVIAAAREAMTNVDRHARASLLTVTVSDAAVALADDGVGFDPDEPHHGHGIDDSIRRRMARAGGHARIRSAPGSGTTTELSWVPTQSVAATIKVDPDRLIDRTRTRYGLALTVYAVVNLAVTVRPEDTVLGAIAGLATLAAVPGILWQRWIYAWPAGAAIVAVAVAQPALLPQSDVLGYAHWAQGAIGWCVLPLLLSLPTGAGGAIITGLWVTNSVVLLVRDPSPEILVNIGLGSASILGVQLFALAFAGLMREAAAVVEQEDGERRRLLTRDRISQALQGEYQRRYATIVDNVVPLLQELGRGGDVDPAMQRRARAECRRLRALFDQAATFDHPLTQAIRPLIDAAEARHVDVATDLSGALPDLDDSQISALIEPLSHVLDRAATSARIVMADIGDEVEISVVIDTENGAGPPPEGSITDVIVSGREMWCLIRAATAPTPLR